MSVDDHNREEKRRDPDRLLSQIQHETQKKNGGALTVFLGMAAGVGKTYAMLQRAKQLKSQSVDVLVGWVDTHGRNDTTAMLSGLEVFPRLVLGHRGVDLEEMDLDGILKRRPKVVLVDELAHTNVPGSRHTKRYLDVLELLNAGIDVFTTINIQHLESRVGIVGEITGVKVHETVPDSVLDQAEEVVLIDLAPEELLRRLKDGRIYPTERATVAAVNFFNKGNLTALREIALRLTAERVDRELRSFKILHGIEEAWKSGSRLLVAIYASPYSETLIRWTRRLADSTDGTWIGVYVEDDRVLSEDEKKLLTRNMALVGQLGGDIVSTRDTDTASGLLRVARQNNVTQIIVGKSYRPFIYRFFKGGSLVDRLIKNSNDIDVYVVAADKTLGGEHKRVGKAKRRPFPWEESGWVIAIAMGTWLIAASLTPFIGYLAVGILFLIAVSIAGLFLARPSVLALAFIFGAIHNFFFIPPVRTFSISKAEDFLTLAMYFVAATTLGHLTTRLKQKELILRSREDRAVGLYNLTRGIAAAKSIEEVIATGIDSLSKAFGTEAAILSPQKESGKLKIHAGSSFLLNEKEIGVAEWSATHSRLAGKFTDTLPASEGSYFPLPGREEVLGALAIKTTDRTVFSADEIALAETFARQIAAGIERELFHERGRRFEVIAETEKLYRTLLDSVSHEFKTPLAAIKGSASALLDPLTAGNKVATTQLLAEVLTGTDRLQRLVENLLDMTRIESGMLQPKRELCDPEDIIGISIRRLEAEKGQQKIIVTTSPDLAPLLCDQVLLVQALVNLLHNALIYGASNRPIEILAKKSAQPSMMDISIRDHGVGLPLDNPESVLKKFYRGHPEQTGGVGIGLSIAQGFIELQGGQLHAANHPEGGAIFTVTMPTGQGHDRRQT